VLQVVEAALAVEAVRQAHGQGDGVTFIAHIGDFALGTLLGLLVKLFGPAQSSAPIRASDPPLQRAAR
jgi:hypothetical protein